MSLKIVDWLPSFLASLRNRIASLRHRIDLLEFFIPLDLDEFDLEDERGAPGYLWRRSAGAVAHVGRDDQLPLLTLAHPAIQRENLSNRKRLHFVTKWCLDRILHRKCNYSVYCLIDVFLNSAKCDSNIIQNNLSGCSADSHTKGDQNQLYIKHKTWGFGRSLVIMSCQPNSPNESLVPAFDDLARPQREGEGIAAGDARVKLAPVFLQGPLQESQVNVSCFYGENVNYCRCFATTSWSESGNQI